MARRAWISIVAAGAAVVVGIAILVVVLSGSRNEFKPDHSTELAADERDAVWACTVLDSLPDPFEEDDLSIQQPPLYRAMAAGGLAWAAASSSSEWSEFQAPGEALITAANNLDKEQLADSVATLRTLCADVPEAPFPGDLDLACEIVATVPDDIPAALKDDPFNSSTLWELMGTGGLLRAGTYADEPLPEELAEAGNGLIQSSQTVDAELAVDSITVISDFCAVHD